jgi:hypothetical protein
MHLIYTENSENDKGSVSGRPISVHILTRTLTSQLINFLNECVIKHKPSEREVLATLSRNNPMKTGTPGSATLVGSFLVLGCRTSFRRELLCNSKKLKPIGERNINFFLQYTSYNLLRPKRQLETHPK